MRFNTPEATGMPPRRKISGNLKRSSEMVNSLALLSVVGTVGQVSPPPILTFEGKPVPYVLPKAVDPEPDADVRGWPGWGTMGASAPKPFFAAGDWSKVTDAVGTTVWRERFVLFAQIDRVVTLPDGTVRLRRYSLNDEQLLDATLSIRRMVATVARATDGQVRLVPDIAIEREGIQTANQSDPYADYLAPRVNGGSFEGEDKAYRGPFHGVMVITPDPVPATRDAVNGLPLVAVPFYGAVRTVDGALFDGWVNQVAERSRRAGLGPVWPYADEWRGVTSFTDLPVEELEANLRKPRSRDSIPSKSLAEAIVPSYRTANYRTSIVSDTDRTRALLVQELPGYRGGGAALSLNLASADLKKTPTLTFWAKSDAKDPVAIGFRTADRHFQVCLGRDLEVPTSAAEIEVPFAYDAAWHSVAIDLRTVVAKIGGIEAVVVEPPQGARIASRVRPPTIEIRFDGFALGTGSADALPARQANFASTDPIERALAAVKATGGDRVKLLSDPDRSVRATALTSLTQAKDPATETALAELTLSIDPQIADLAVAALAHQGTDTANLALRNALKNGLTDRVRASAAIALAQSKDPKLAGDIMILLANRSWQTRVASLVALANLPGNESGIIRLSYLQQTDPAIKLAATVAADPSREYDMRKLQWSAVNEPSDLVRLTSLKKLIQSADPTFRTDGYKGVRDDSAWVRAELLRWLGENPSDAHRGAILLGLTDSHAAVRAAAIQALPAGVGLADLGAIASDRYPLVQKALILWATKRKISLPANLIATWTASPDPEVRQAIGQYNQP